MASARRSTAHLLMLPVLVSAACGEPEWAGRTAEHGQPLLADTTVEVTPDETCPACRVELRRVATIGDTVLPGALTDQSWVNAGADGRFYVYDVFTAPGRLQVFDSAGRFLRMVGGPGDGPGEYGFPSRVFPRGPDTIQVMDFTHRRITTLHTDDYHVVDVRGLPMVSKYSAVLGDGRLVMNGPLRTTEAMGYPLHVLDVWKQETHSFGTDDPLYDPTDQGQILDTHRTVGPSRGARFWAARRNEYAIERWTADGELREVLEREVPWFPPWRGQMSIPPWAAPPRPEIAAITEDRNGLLWVLVHVPDPHWQGRAPVESSRVPGEMTLRPRSYHDFYDTVVEVWDTTSRRVLTSFRSPLRLKGFLHGGLLYSAREDSVDNRFYDVWRPEFVGPDSNQGAGHE